LPLAQDRAGSPTSPWAVTVVVVQNESAPGSLSREALVEQPSPELLADNVDAPLKTINGTKVTST